MNSSIRARSLAARSSSASSTPWGFRSSATRRLASRPRPGCAHRPPVPLGSRRSQYSLAPTVDGGNHVREGDRTFGREHQKSSALRFPLPLRGRLHHPLDTPESAQLETAFSNIRLWLSIMLEDDIAAARWTQGALRWRAVLAACDAYAPRIISFATAPPEQNSDWVQLSDELDVPPSDTPLHVVTPDGKDVFLPDILKNVSYVMKDPRGREAMGNLTSEAIQRFVSSWVKHYNKVYWHGSPDDPLETPPDELEQMTLLRLALASFFRHLGRTLQPVSKRLDAEVGKLLLGGGLFATVAWIVEAAMSFVTAKPMAAQSLKEQEEILEAEAATVQYMMDGLVGSLQQHLDLKWTESFQHLLAKTRNGMSTAPDTIRSGSSTAPINSYLGTLSPSPTSNAPLRAEDTFAPTAISSWDQYVGAIKILARSLARGLTSLPGWSFSSSVQTSTPISVSVPMLELIIGFTKSKLPFRPSKVDRAEVCADLDQFIETQSKRMLAGQSSLLPLDSEAFRQLFFYALNVAQNPVLAAQLSFAYLPLMHQEGNEQLANELRAQLIRHAVTQDPEVWSGNKLNSADPKTNRKKQRYLNGKLSVTNVPVVDLLTRWDNIHAFWAVVFGQHVPVHEDTAGYPSFSDLVGAESSTDDAPWDLFVHAFQQSLLSGNAACASQLLKWAMHQPFWRMDVDDAEIVLRRLLGMVWPSLLSEPDLVSLVGEEGADSLRRSHFEANASSSDKDMFKVWTSSVSLDQHMLYAALQLCRKRNQYDLAYQVWHAARRHYDLAARHVPEQEAKVIMPHPATMYFQILAKMAHRTQLNAVPPGGKREGKTPKRDARPRTQPAQGYSLLDLKSALNTYLYLSDIWRLPARPDTEHFRAEIEAEAAAQYQFLHPPEEPSESPDQPYDSPNLGHHAPDALAPPQKPVTRPTAQLFQAVLDVYANSLVGLQNGDPRILARAQDVLRLILYHMHVFDVKVHGEHAQVVNDLLEAEFWW